MGQITEQLLAYEHALATGQGDAYRARLAEDAVVVVPGYVLDRDATIAAMDASPGWDEVDLAGASTRPLGEDGAVLTYTFTGRRGEYEYRAVLSSAYARRDGDWKLVLHQQTPLG
jgi:hypothetical protein